MTQHVLAIDLGSSNGRAMLGTFDGKKLELKELHRFQNIPITKNGTLHWDFFTLLEKIKRSLQMASQEVEILSIGIDTWGVDFGLLDDVGDLIDLPVHYRDQRTIGMVEEVNKICSNETLYQLTGNQIMNINTLFQLVYLQQNDQLENVSTMLLMPDLFNYYITGIKKTEETIASTTQLFDPFKKQWNDQVIAKLGLPKTIFTEIAPPGTILGKIKEELARELNIPQISVVNICSHDTASAVVSVPNQEDFLFISCGTWALVGTELDEPIINEKSYQYNLTNESGFNKTTRFLKNITGMWILQELKKELTRKGKDYSYDEITEIAMQAKPFKCFIDTDHSSFQQPGNMIERIQDYARKTNQEIPETDGELVRCIYESLAFKFRYTIEEILDCVGKSYNKINIVGGGSRAEILCQMTADATGLITVAGPVEASSIGNCLVQLITHGHIKDIHKAREIVNHSFNIQSYHPKNEQVWNEHYDRYKQVLENEEV